MILKYQSSQFCQIFLIFYHESCGLHRASPSVFGLIVYMVTGGAAMHLNDAFADVFSGHVHACIMNKAARLLLKVMLE